jgi:hypothetical protein
MEEPKDWAGKVSPYDFSLTFLMGIFSSSMLKQRRSDFWLSGSTCPRIDAGMGQVVFLTWRRKGRHEQRL